ncbi:MAG TPA: universal stress protein [Actinomycetota bacterium]|jgi:nucleotide-binding universal stress UspA family protein|nr:universal stress protein [Actinomycetota bacterium]
MGRIVVGVDGSENSQLALAWAAAEAKLRGSSLHLIHSWTFPPAFPGADGLPRADLKGSAEQVLADAVASLPKDGEIQLKAEVANELPAQALIGASEGAEMIVVGSRGRGGFKGLLLGSVSQQVVHHAHCPIVIVPHSERAK